MRKPFGAKAHCFIDYGFAALQIALPKVLGLNKKATERSQMLGISVLAYSVLTKSSVALKHAIPFKVHKWLDVASLATLALTTLAPDVRKDKKALAFHLGLLALGATAVTLTDWNDDISGKAGWETVVTETD